MFLWNFVKTKKKLKLTNMLGNSKKLLIIWLITVLLLQQIQLELDTRFYFVCTIFWKKLCKYNIL